MTSVFQTQRTCLQWIGCDEDELAAWEKWGSKDLAAVDAEVARLTAKSQETMKKGMREGIVADLKMIKLVQKAKKPKTIPKEIMTRPQYIHAGSRRQIQKQAVGMQKADGWLLRSLSVSADVLPCIDTAHART